MKITTTTKQLKNAISAVDAMSKKISFDYTEGDSKISLLYKESGLSVVAAHDYFFVEIPLKEVDIKTEENDCLLPMKLDSMPSHENIVGLYNSSEMLSLLSKLPATSTIELKVTEKSIDINANKNSYSFSTGTARKTVACYKTNTDSVKILSLEDNQFQWLCDVIASCAKLVKPTAIQPAYGNVCINATPTEQKTLRISANSNTDGYSVIYDTVFNTNINFTALMPKNLSEAFNTFITKLGSPDGIVDIYCQFNNDTEEASMLFFESESFSLGIGCSLNLFPFNALDNIISASTDTQCKYNIDYNSYKKCIDRMSVFASTDNSVTEFEMKDGGAVEVTQKKDIMSSSVSANEMLNNGTMEYFTDEKADLTTTVRTKTIKSILPVLDNNTITMGLGKTKKESDMPRLCLISDNSMAKIYATILGVQI